MKRIQNKIAESRWSLPATAAFAVLVWALNGAIVNQWWMQFACFVLSCYMIVELNTTFVLMRTYSRMISCAYITLSCCSSFLFPEADGGILSLCYVASFMPLFNSYQDKSAVGWTFYAFLSLGVASLLWVQMLYFVPLTLLLATFCLRSMSGRTFMAAIIGLLTPYWFASVYFVLHNDFATPLQHFMGLAEFKPLEMYTTADGLANIYATLGLNRIIAFAFTMTLVVTGLVHYLRTKYKDKLNTRMYYDVFIVNTIAATTFLMLQPQHFDMLHRIIIANGSPIIAHYITHTRTYVTNISFLAMLAASIAITVLNIFI